MVVVVVEAGGVPLAFCCVDSLPAPDLVVPLPPHAARTTIVEIASVDQGARLLCRV
jgi:hypothetical protein